MPIDPSATLTGAYSTATLTMPDGSQRPVLVRMVPRGDGSTGMVVIDDADLEFEKRFQGTSTVPNDQAPVDTEVLTRKAQETLRSESSTRIRLMSADMVAFIGDPDRILAQGALDPERLAHLRAHPTSATLARRICVNMGGKWAQVAKLIPCFYPCDPGTGKTRPRS